LSESYGHQNLLAVLIIVPSCS